MATSIYRVREAPCPRSLIVSPKSHARWAVAFDTAQRMDALSWDQAVAKARKFEPEFRDMVLVRLAAIRHVPIDFPSVGS